MSLNCLSCRILKRTVSNNGRDHCAKPNYTRKMGSNDRCKSEISPAAYEQLRMEEAMMSGMGSKKGRHRRLNTIDTTYGAVAFEADVNPKLVRSPGMRRDWSFEKVIDEKMRNEMRLR
ncbi:hypothetical protein like AT2G35215 [Hibiscus trionum]|uniref:Uncharacterized protein n=1 Tax=Hibiscus trionum TaxID=183268 RepID=A0A9W7JK29_HIBTR|nr:hypothetical protein like AT2G35215 [Hibiscus trionum]